MLVLPLDLTQKFQTLLAQAGVPINQRPYYHKWLRTLWGSGTEPRTLRVQADPLLNNKNINSVTACFYYKK